MQILAEVIDTNLATKQDVKDLHVNIDRVRSDMNNGFVQLEQRMTIKLGSLLIAGIGILYAMLKFSI